MLTTSNICKPEVEQEKPQTVQRKDLDTVLKLEDVQKMFLPGSDAYNKVQDIINSLK